MSWCYPTEGSFKLRLRQVRKNYDKWLAKAVVLRHWVCEEFAWDKKHEELVGVINYIWEEEVDSGLEFE
jgi:hypothetical protein